jgi:hypothetical protein
MKDCHFVQSKNDSVWAENTKFQITNHKKIPTRGASACAARDQNSKFQTCFGHWILEFEIYLEFGA